MMKKIITITVTILILTSAFLVLSLNFSSASASGPFQLSIYTGPNSVLADNESYNCIFVQLQDSSGQPSRALQDTTISLSSSLTIIGTVDPAIIILNGTTYASANFKSTFSPGTTMISASATGYATVQTAMTTIGPIPSAIVVYGVPSTLPADGGSYAAIMVQLQDSTGVPAKAPKGGVQVMLVSANSNVGTVTPSVTILGGQTYAIGTFTTNATAPGQAVVYAIAPNYATSQVTITTQSISPASPSQLKMFVGPPQFPADENAHSQIAVELLDASGNIAAASSSLQVILASSDESIATIGSEITIPNSRTYALTTLKTTYKSGSTTLTAATTNLTAGISVINTIGFAPSKLAVFCVPPTLPSDNATYQIIQVQLQDSQGRPAIDPVADVMVNLFTSQPTVGVIGSTLTIPFGKTQTIGSFTVTSSPGTTSVTAQASGYTTGQASVTTCLIDFATLQITLTPNPGNVNNGNDSEITAFVTANGVPVKGATITFTSNNGGTFSPTTEQGNGYYETSFTAPSFPMTTTCTITASGLKTGYLSAPGNTQINVTPAGTPTPSPTPISTNISNAGTISMLIEDSSGKQQDNVVVSSTAQPAGMPTLSNITNATGYVTFPNATSGTYSFTITKEGYPQVNETFDYNAQPLTLTITLPSSSTNGNNSGNTMVIIMSVAIAATVVALISGMYIVKRKKSPNIRKLQELQKQMKPKFEQ